MSGDGGKLSRDKTIANTYLELHRFGQSKDYDKALKATNRILHMSPLEKEALHCKIVCLIHQSKFGEALQLIEKTSQVSSDLYYEKAYCYYRDNKPEQALAVIASAAEPDPKLNELKAQILYRLERYRESYGVYRDVIKSSNDEYEDERQTNLQAVISQLDDGGGREAASGQLRTDTYELLYNAACVSIGQGAYAEAERRLRQCEKLCRETFDEEDELELELAPIRVQLGFACQKLGRAKEARNLFAAALKLKLDDAALAAVANNNSVVINRDENVFDSKKKMRAAMGETAALKLTSRQRRWVAYNNAVLMYYTNQTEQCAKACAHVEQNYPDLAVRARLVHAMCLFRGERAKEALELIDGFETDSKGDRLLLKLASVHLLLTQGKQGDACEVLENLGDDTYRPGIVGALTTLHLGAKRKETALNVFERTISHYQKQKLANSNLNDMWHQAADFHLRHGQPSTAAKSLEELIKNDPGDKRAVAQLAIAYAQFDKNKAAKLLNDLPGFAETRTEAELDALENSNWVTLKKSAGKTEPTPGTPRSEAVDKKRTKRNHKRKIRLPKFYDAKVPPDPERWLPRYERSGYRKKRDRRAKEVVKGSQGTMSGQVDQYDFSSKAAEIERSPPSSVEPSPQFRPPNKKGGQQKKKNKRR